MSSINENLKEARAKVKITKPIPKNMTKGDKHRHDAQNHLEMSQSTTRSGLGNKNQNKIGHSHGFLKSTMAANRADAKDAEDSKVSKPMKEPEKGKKPVRIVAEGSPGGPFTPGAKAERAADEAAKKKSDEAKEKKRQKGMSKRQSSDSNNP